MDIEIRPVNGRITSWDTAATLYTTVNAGTLQLTQGRNVQANLTLSTPTPVGNEIGKRYVPSSADGGAAVLLTAASWVLQRLPGAVLEEQRGALLQTLAEARDLVVEVHCRPSIILVRDGDRPLVKLAAG